MKLVFIILSLLPFASPINNLVVTQREIEISVKEEHAIVFEIQQRTVSKFDGTRLILSKSPFVHIDPDEPIIKNGSVNVSVIGLYPAASAFVEVLNCSSDESVTCPLDTREAYCRVTVIRSHLLALVIQLVGWTYFAAWSVSFYPQIILNFNRKSVVGLNFDFLALNLVGFAAYSMFNLLLFYNNHVKEIYRIENPRSPPPVLLNDVVFAIHAFIACSVTILQCMLFKRDSQRVSRKCFFLIIFFLSFFFFSACATVLNRISILSFVTSLSYIKMAVTCCKYFPQAYFNYKRKSTVGWSIGNIILDFTGGSLDILQMILQAINVNDWSAFYTNPVKFGLGLVSILFDIFFIFQHSVLYQNTDMPHNAYSGIDNPDILATSDDPTEVIDFNTEPIVTEQDYLPS